MGDQKRREGLNETILIKKLKKKKKKKASHQKFVFKSCTTAVADFPTEGESCCLTLLCLCDASVIKDLQGLENASLCIFFL